MVLKYVKTLLVSLLTFATLAVAKPAHAYNDWIDGPIDQERTVSRIGPSINYTFDKLVMVDLDLALIMPLSRTVDIGVRGGVLAFTSPLVWGVPADMLIDFNFRRFYFEGLGGAWLIFSDGATLHGHIGGAIGVRMNGYTFGPEVSYIAPGIGMVGFRLSMYL